MLELIEDLGVIQPTPSSTYKVRYGLYRCECGKEFKTQTRKVKNGTTQSCGCLQKKKAKEYQTTHGLSGHPLYKVWKQMRARCNSKSNKSYQYYGGRGIKVCKEWDTSFDNFYVWAYGSGYTFGLTIDRKDNDGNYEPSNCRWVTQEVQARNTRELRSHNTSGYRGVSFHKGTDKWQANICVGYNQVYLGLFNTAEEASEAYKKYVKDNQLDHNIGE